MNNLRRKRGSIAALGWVIAAALGLFGLWLFLDPLAVSARVPADALALTANEAEPAAPPLASGIDPSNPDIAIAVVALTRKNLGETAEMTLALRVTNTGTQDAMFHPLALHLGVRHASDTCICRGSVFTCTAPAVSCRCKCDAAPKARRNRRSLDRRCRCPHLAGQVYPPETNGGSITPASAITAGADVALMPGKEIFLPLTFRVPVQVQQVDLVLGLGSSVWTFLEL